MKIDVNTYYSELMIIFFECLLAVDIDEKGHTDRDLIFEEKRQETLVKSFVVNLLELIQVNVMMKIIKLVEYKHLLASLETEN